MKNFLKKSRSKIAIFSFLFLVTMSFVIIPANASGNAYAFESYSHYYDCGWFCDQYAYMFVKVQGDAVYDSSSGGTNDWYLNIRNLLYDRSFLGSAMLGVRAHFAVSAYYKVLDCGYGYCSTSYRWDSAPSGLFQLEGDYTYRSGPVQVSWQVSGSVYGMGVSASISGSTSVSHVSQNSIDGTFRNIGYLQSYRGLGVPGTPLDATIIIPIHISNFLAREYAGSGYYNYATPSYYEKVWILGLRVRVAFDLTYNNYWSPPAYQHSFTLGNSDPIESDMGAFRLVPGTVSLT